MVRFSWYGSQDIFQGPAVGTISNLSVMFSERQSWVIKSRMHITPHT